MEMRGPEEERRRVGEEQMWIGAEKQRSRGGRKIKREEDGRRR